MSGPIPSESAGGDPRSLMRGIASARVAAGEKHAEISIGRKGFIVASLPDWL